MPDAVTQAALAVPATGDISLVALFLQAHIVVKLVIIGLLLASVWSWAIIVDKTLLYGRVRRQMDRFEKLFWSGQSLEELYRSLTGRTPTAMASVFVAAMREWKRSFEAGARSPIGLQTRIDKVLDVDHRPRDRAPGAAPAVPGDGRLGGAVHRPVRHGMGHHDARSRRSPPRRTRRSPWWRPASPRRCSPPRSACSPPFPAVIAYNKLSNEAGKIGQRLEGFADEFSAILSRQVDERA